jgi:hypothetical protein
MFHSTSEHYGKGWAGRWSKLMSQVDINKELEFNVYNLQIKIVYCSDGCRLYKET